MSKIKLLNPVNVAKTTANAVKKPHFPKTEKVLSTKVAELDFSTEEYGFFMYNGKIVNIIYPR